MDESLTISSHTTGTYLKDDKDTGMLEWQRYMQQAYEVMYIINPTKIDYREGRDIYTIRDPDSTGKPYMYTIGRENTGTSGSNFGT